MSYIKIEIGGRERGIKFSQGTNVLLQDRLADCDESERKAFGVQFIVWAGLKTNCVIKGERFTKTVEDKEEVATFEDVCAWVELLPADVIINIVELYAEVNPPKENSEPEKKNQPDTVIEQNVTSLPAES